MRQKGRSCGFHCIKMKDLNVRFGDNEVLKNINLHIHCGTLAAVIGRNGAGKSTLVRAILGEIPHGGSIEFKNTEDGRIKKLVIGYVPQSINIEKNTPMDVYDLLVSFHYKTPLLFKQRRIRQEVAEALAEFEASDLIDHPIGRLSGGQLQRVMLAMAVMNEPNLLILDEPVSGIDKMGMDLFYEKMRELTDHHDLAVILISHDLDYVAKYADHVILLDREVLCEGTPGQVFSDEAFLSMFGGASYPLGPHRARDIYPARGTHTVVHSHNHGLGGKTAGNAPGQEMDGVEACGHSHDHGWGGKISGNESGHGHGTDSVEASAHSHDHGMEIGNVGQQKGGGDRD